jgi:uncharacterized damage-inducible protein DinB
MTTDPNSIEGTLTRSALLDRIARSWDELWEALRDLDDQRLAAPGPDGWAIKDHLAHLAHWEQYFVATLHGGDQLAALGLPADQERSESAVNAALQRLDASLPPAEARRLLVEAHARTVAVLEALAGEDLERHMGHIEGNTNGHLDEHRAWIMDLAASRP